MPEAHVCLGGGVTGGINPRARDGGVFREVRGLVFKGVGWFSGGVLQGVGDRGRGRGATYLMGVSGGSTSGDACIYLVGANKYQCIYVHTYIGDGSRGREGVKLGTEKG